MTDQKMLLNVNLQGFGQRPASWRTQENVNGTELNTAEFWANLGRIAERGRLDGVFFADHPALDNPNVRPLGLVEPFIALGAIAEATENLSLVGSASTTYNDPYDLAERLLSLDVLTGGRLAWNAVTTYAQKVSQNFGIVQNPDRPVRYRRAREFTSLVRRLWQSAATGEVVRHRGEFFELEGTLNVPPSPQGHPAIFQAGGSPDGRDLASAVADAVFSVELNLEPAIQNRKAVKDSAVKYGRSPNDVKVIPGLSMVLGSTEEEARRRYDEMEALAPDDYMIKNLASFLGDEIREANLDEPVPNKLLDRKVDEATFQRSLAYRETIIEWIRRKNTSLRDVLRNFGGYGSRIIVGTPEKVADSLEEWFKAGAADGFNLMVDEFPRGLETIVDQVIPILQNRGLFDRDYGEDTITKRLRTGGREYKLDFQPTLSDNGTSRDSNTEVQEVPTLGGHQWDSEASYGFSTQQLYGGQYTHGPYHPRITPIYMTAGYVFNDFKDAQRRFAQKSSDLIYTRSGNPTVKAVERKLAVLENGRNALLVASGQAATHVATIGLLQAGDHILSAPNIYEGSRTLFSLNYRRLGIEVEFLDKPNDAEEWRSKVRENTKLFFGESIPNPRNDLLDLELIAQVAQEFGVPFVVDNTLATPALLRPLDYGVDVVVHSASKFLTGQGAALSGAIVDAGRFDFSAYPEKYPQFSTPLHVKTDATANQEYGKDAYYQSMLFQIAANYGPTPSAFNAFLLQQGLETLNIRIARQSQNALQVAQWLEEQPQVAHVDYSGLDSNAYAPLAHKYLPNGQGAVFSFTVYGGEAAAEKVINSVRLINRMTHIGDARTLILHPATTTHSKLAPAIVEHLGIKDGLIRLSVGLEDPEDLIADLQSTFAKL
jgi:FMN-dependent oxidoreductase (nitrilotriacetate monooxygenase family)